MSLWNIFAIISGKFPPAKLKLFQTVVDEGWNNFLKNLTMRQFATARNPACYEQLADHNNSRLTEYFQVEGDSFPRSSWSHSKSAQIIPRPSMEWTLGALSAIQCSALSSTAVNHINSLLRSTASPCPAQSRRFYADSAWRL